MTEPWPEHFSPDVVREAYGSRLAGYTVALEAWRRGLRVTFFDSIMRRYEISSSQRRIRFDKSRPSVTAKEAVRVVQDKFTTSSRLRAAGVPVPESTVISSDAPDAEKTLCSRASEFGYPVVLKPLRGSMGRDVHTGISTETQLLETYRRMTSRDREQQKIVLEAHFEGEDYRVLVVGDRATAACLRLPANVEGDGVHTVAELIAQKNELRKTNPYLCKKLIKQDHEVDQHLARRGYDISSVPEPGEVLRLRGRANASMGGDSFDVTATLPEHVKQAAVRAVAAVPGLSIAGVDILLDPHRRPVEDSFRVIEMNSRPEIEINMYPWEGAGQDAPADMVDVFFPESRRPQGPGVASVALNVEEIVTPLRTGVADQVRLKPRPSHLYPVRVSLLCDSQPMTVELRNEVHLMARQAGVAGSYTPDTEGTRLVVAGETERVDKFLKKVSRPLKLRPSSRSPWEGVVSQGFRISLPGSGYQGRSGTIERNHHGP